MRLRTVILFIVIFFSSCQQTNEELIERAITLKQKGKYKEAIKIYSDIINQNGKLQVPYYNRGLCYVGIKNYQNALDDFNEVLSLQQVGSFIFKYNSDSPFADEEARAQVPFNDALYQRAQVFYEMDSIKSSFRDFKQLISQNYEKSNCMVWQGVLWLKGGNNNNSCQSFVNAKQFALDDEDRKEADKFIQSHCKDRKNFR